MMEGGGKLRNSPLLTCSEGRGQLKTVSKLQLYESELVLLIDVYSDGVNLSVPVEGSTSGTDE